MTVAQRLPFAARRLCGAYGKWILFTTAFVSGSICSIVSASGLATHHASIELDDVALVAASGARYRDRIHHAKLRRIDLVDDAGDAVSYTHLTLPTICSV